MSTEEISLNSLIKAIKHHDGYYDVFYCNGVKMGTFEYGEDGYLYYWPVDRSGCWSSEMLILTGELLNHLNKPWDEQVRKGLGGLND